MPSDKIGVARLPLLRPEAEYPESLLEQLPARQEYGAVVFAHHGQMSKVINSKNADDLRKRMAGQEKLGSSMQAADWPADQFDQLGELQSVAQPMSQPASVVPTPSAGKFSGTGLVTQEIFNHIDIPDELRGGVLSAANFGLAANTHSAYLTALKRYRVCLEKYGMAEEWPVPRKCLITFVGWAVDVAKLQPSTIKTYLASLTKYSMLASGVALPKDPLVDLMLRGAANSGVASKKKKVFMKLQ